MRITYREIGHMDYWEQRWGALAVDEPMSNEGAYPLKYALLATDENPGRVLEAGCGAGRILRYFDREKVDIIGFDYISSVVIKLKKTDKKLQVNSADVTRLPYACSSFNTIMAFGLLHNLSLNSAKIGLEEMWRVLQPDGKVCLSFRADNVQNWINDNWMGLISLRKKRIFHRFTKEKELHKVNLTKKELKLLVESAGFNIEYFDAVQNMPFLYKFRYFRLDEQKEFNEIKARRDGYKLNRLGDWLQSMLMLFPNSFCSLYVVIAKKKPIDHENSRGY